MPVKGLRGVRSVRASELVQLGGAIVLCGLEQSSGGSREWSICWMQGDGMVDQATHLEGLVSRQAVRYQRKPRTAGSSADPFSSAK